MVQRAEREELEVVGVVEDIRVYQPTEAFDIVILDRTLHMLPDVSDRMTVLDCGASSLKLGGHMLIADEPSNMPGIATFFERVDRGWTLQNGLKPSLLIAMRTA